MATPLTHLAVMNAALARVAGGSIMSEEEDTDLAAQTIAVYYDRLDAVLAMTDWSFAEKTYKLDLIAETAENGWDDEAQKFITGWRYAFAMPGTRLSLPRRVMTNPRAPSSPLREFAVEQNTLYADRSPLWAAFTVRADPSVWPPSFRLALTTIVAADLCVPVSHDAGLAKELRALAEGSPEYQGRGGLIGTAMAHDAAGARKKAPYWSDPLTDARLG